MLHLQNTEDIDEQIYTFLLSFYKVILQSESLKEPFSELDMTSEVLEITMSPSQPYFRCVNKSFLRQKKHFVQLQSYSYRNGFGKQPSFNDSFVLSPGYLHLGTLEMLIMITPKTQIWWSCFGVQRHKPTGTKEQPYSYNTKLAEGNQTVFCTSWSLKLLHYYSYTM